MTPKIAALALALGASAAGAQTPSETPLMVYGPKALRAEDLKIAYGEGSVMRSGSDRWAVQKPLALAVPFDFVVYKEGAQGDLVEMTGFVVGECEKVMDAFFKSMQPLQLADRGARFNARMLTTTVRIDANKAPDGMVNFGGQSLDLSRSPGDTRTPCTFTHTFRRKP